MGLIFAGCEASVSTEDQIDTEKAAKVIQDEYPNKAGGVTLTSIECEGGDAKVGTEFTCDATNDADVAVDIDAKVTGVSDDGVDLHWEVAKLTAKGTTFAGPAAAELSKIRAVDSVDCPDGIVIEEGTVVDCTATMDDGSERPVKLTLTDGSGAFHAELLGGPS